MDNFKVTGLEALALCADIQERLGDDTDVLLRVDSENIDITIYTHLPFITVCNLLKPIATFQRNNKEYEYFVVAGKFELIVEFREV